MAEEAKSQSSSSSPLRLVIMLVVLIAAVLVVKFIFGVALTVLKWGIIIAVALGITWYVMRRMGKKS